MLYLFCSYIFLSMIFNIKKQNRKILILFDFGFFLYLVTPLIISDLKPEIFMNVKPIENFYYVNSDKIMGKLSKIIAILFLWNISFKIPFFNDNYKKNNNLNNLSSNISNKIIYLINFFLLIIVLGITITNYKIFIDKYKYMGNFRSILATCINIFFINTIYILVKEKKKYNFQLIIYSGLSLILLVMGSRMYFVMGIVSYLFYLEQNYKISKKKVILLAMTTFLVTGYITLYRAGAKFNLLNLILNNLFEFLFTGISYITFITSNEIPYISMPNQLISALGTFVPSFLFRTQSNYVSSYIYFSPFGAKNIFVSLMENFGIIGSIIFLFLGGYIINKCHFSKNFILKTWIYFIAGAIPFLFFRDPLNTFLYKISFEYSIFVLFLEYIITVFFKKLKF